MTFYSSFKTRANSISRFWYSQSYGLLLIRTALGTIFFIHGMEKLAHIQIAALQMTFLNLGGAPTAYFVAGLEVVGGVALILGVATRLFGVLFGIEMLIAAMLVGAPRGFHGYEFQLLLSAAAFGIALMGSGIYSVFPMECKTCRGFLCNGTEAGCKRRR